MSRKPFIVILTDIYWPSKGGVEESIRSLSSALADHFEIRIITHAQSSGKSGLSYKTFLLPSFNEYRDEAGNRVIPLIPNTIQRLIMLPFILWHFPLLRRINAKKLFDYLYRFYKRAYKEKFSFLIGKADIIHSFSTGYLGILASELCTTKNSVLIHTPYIHFGRWGDSPMQMKVYTTSAALICPTERFKKEIKKRISNISARILVNPPLPPRPPEELIPPKEFDVKQKFILFLGRREEHKGLTLLLKAFEQIETSFRLVIAGPGEMIISLPPHCIDLGEVEEGVKHWLLSRCTIFCVPSTNESFGMVYTEAMAYNKPVVALDIPPVNEIIINNETGILVTPNKSKALAGALLRLIQNKKTREKQGKAAGRRYRKYYSPEHSITVIREVYTTLLEEKKNSNEF